MGAARFARRGGGHDYHDERRELLLMWRKQPLSSPTVSAAKTRIGAAVGEVDADAYAARSRAPRANTSRPRAARRSVLRRRGHRDLRRQCATPTGGVGHCLVAAHGVPSPIFLRRNRARPHGPSMSMTPMSCSISTIVVPYCSLTSSTKRTRPRRSSPPSARPAAGAWAWRRSRGRSTRFWRPYGSRPTRVLRTRRISRNSITSSTFRRCGAPPLRARPHQTACSRVAHLEVAARHDVVRAPTCRAKERDVLESARDASRRGVVCVHSRRSLPVKVILLCGRAPAPLGPMIARTSCSRTSNQMSVNAFTPPNASQMWASLRQGVADGGAQHGVPHACGLAH